MLTLRKMKYIMCNVYACKNILLCSSSLMLFTKTFRKPNGVLLRYSSSIPLSFRLFVAVLHCIITVYCQWEQWKSILSRYSVIVLKLPLNLCQLTGPTKSKCRNHLAHFIMSLRGTRRTNFEHICCMGASVLFCLSLLFSTILWWLVWQS